HRAIQRDLPLTQPLQVDRRTESAPDQAADLLLATAVDAAIPRDALRAGRRDHGVLAGDPALAATLQERRHLLLDRRGAQNPRFAHSDHARRRSCGEKARLDLDRPNLLRSAPVGAYARLRHRGIKHLPGATAPPPPRRAS